ncbi:MAG: hypothetical protein U0T80_00860 [Flavobacteriaceae bacterium]
MQVNFELNIHTTSLNYQATESGEITIFDLNGRLVNTTQVATGDGFQLTWIIYKIAIIF